MARTYTYDLTLWRDEPDPGVVNLRAEATLEHFLDVRSGNTESAYDVTVFPPSELGALDSYNAGLVFHIGRGWETLGGRYRTLREAVNAKVQQLADRKGWVAARPQFEEVA